MPVGPLSQPGASSRLPTVPTGVSASAIAGTTTSAAGGATISFTESTNPGKPPTGAYVATSSPGSFTASANSSPITFSSGVFTAGTEYTFTVVKRSGSGITSNQSSATSAVMAFTIPNAPSITFTNNDNTVDWSWASGGDNGSAIVEWEYAVSTNDGAYSPEANTSTTTAAYPGSIDNYRNTNKYQLRVRARNAAGWSAYAYSGNSTPWTRTIGSESTETVYDAYTSSGCDSTCCNTCGTQARHRRKFSQRQVRTDTWTRGTSTNTQYVVVTNFTGDTNGDGTVDNWGLVSSYTACEDNGSCSTTARATYSAAFDGQIINTACGYRTWSSYYGAWAATDSNGNFNWISGNLPSGCNSNPCYVFSESLTYCPASPCASAFECVGLIRRGNCCGFLGCSPQTCT